MHKDADFINGGLQVGAVVECFVCRGQRNNRAQLYNLLCDGDLDEEIEGLRKAAAPF